MQLKELPSLHANLQLPPGQQSVRGSCLSCEAAGGKNCGPACTIQVHGHEVLQSWLSVSSLCGLGSCPSCEAAFNLGVVRHARRVVSKASQPEVTVPAAAHA